MLVEVEEKNIVLQSFLGKLSERAYFRDEHIALFMQDSIDLMAQLPTESIDMIFADPPYMLSNDGISCQAGKMVKVNKGEWDRSKGFEYDVQFHGKWISECRRLLKPEGTIWISGTNHNIYQCGYICRN